MEGRTRLEHALRRLDARIDWERKQRGAMRPSLDSVRDLMRRLGHPERAFRAVHVAGTKGKGSTAALIAAGLEAAGIASGLYTSPHVERIEERVRLRGENVEAGRLAGALEQALDAVEEAVAEGSDAKDATWFDLLTAAAFIVFRDAGLAWAVVECGLGGRLDSTNVLSAELCVITNIELEHTDVLGDTRQKIAAEKAGILDAGTRLVTALAPDSEEGGVVWGRAAELAVPVERSTPPEGATWFERNLSLASLALDQLGQGGLLGREGRVLSGARLDPGTIEAARLPGRGELFRLGSTFVYLDSAHTQASVRLVLEGISAHPDWRPNPVVLLALGRDKASGAILKTLREHADTVLCTTLSTGPLSCAPQLAEAARAAGFRAESIPDPQNAFERAIQLAAEERWVLVIGSFYLAGAVRSVLPADSKVVGEPRCSRSSPISS